MNNPSIKIPIHEFLPHREPMLMVDYIEEISADHVVCSFEVLADNIFLSDERFQEVGLIEHMAQTCSSIVGQTYYGVDYNPELDTRVVGFISGIKAIHIQDLPNRGDRIQTISQLKSKFEGEGYTICTMEVESKVGERLCAKAEINLFLQERK